MHQHHLECGVNIPIPNGADGKPNLLAAAEIRLGMQRYVKLMMKALDKEFHVVGARSHEKLFQHDEAHTLDPDRHEAVHTAPTKHSDGAV